MFRVLMAVIAVLFLTGAASAQQCGVVQRQLTPVYQAASPIVYQTPMVLLAPLYVVPSSPTVVVQQQVQYVPQVLQQVQYVPQVVQQVQQVQYAPQYAAQVQQQVIQKNVVQRAPVVRSFSIQRTIQR